MTAPSSLTPLAAALRSPAATLALAAIRGYQRWISPRKGFHCAYRVHAGGAGCSGLGLRVIRRFGLIGGLTLLRERLARCSAIHAAVHAAHRPEAVPLPTHRRPAAAQRGDCDPGCGACDGPGGADCLPDVCGHHAGPNCFDGGGSGGRCRFSVCDLADCCSCDWPGRKDRKGRTSREPRRGRPRR